MSVEGRVECSGSIEGLCRELRIGAKSPYFGGTDQCKICERQGKPLDHLARSPIIPCSVAY